MSLCLKVGLPVIGLIYLFYVVNARPKKFKKVPPYSSEAELLKQLAIAAIINSQLILLAAVPFVFGFRPDIADTNNVKLAGQLVSDPQETWVLLTVIGLFIYGLGLFIYRKATAPKFGSPSLAGVTKRILFSVPFMTSSLSIVILIDAGVSHMT